MKLNFDQICSVCLGAVRAKEMEDGVRLYRFTEEQEEIYRQRKTAFYNKTFATAGMKLYFETDSCSLFLRVNVTPGSAREYFSIDVKVNGEIVGYLDNYSDVALPQDYTKIKLQHGEFTKRFNLGEGTKKVCIYLPWSVAVEIRELSLEENTFIKPIKPAKKLLVFGDSITQGYDALRPSRRYAARLAEALDAEEINKGIGGEIFFPALAEHRDDFEPDFITVAYGTNDWSKTKEEDFKNGCKAFFAALSKHYPKARIFALTPIWRKDYMETRVFGEFSRVAEEIENIVSSFKNVTYTHGFEFVPQEEKFFGDLKLHPNDSGFDHFYQNLYEQVMRSLN